MALLTVGNLWSAGTTFVLFAVVARLSSTEVLGRFSVVLAATTLVVQLVDGGAGLLMARDAAQSSNPWGVLGARLVSRMRTTAALSGGLVLTLALLDMPPEVIALAVVMTVVQSLYGFLLIAHQSQGSFRRAAVTQGANGVAYLVGCAALLSLGSAPSLGSVLLVPVLGLLVGVLVGRSFLAECWRRRADDTVRWNREFLFVRVGAVASAVTSNVDQLLLGRAGAGVVGRYAASQRPAQGISAVSLALSGFLLRSASVGTSDTHRRITTASWRLAMLAPVAAGVAVLIGREALPLLYGRSDLASASIFGTLVLAYLLGAASTGPSSILYARRKGDVVAALVIVQSLVVVAAGAVASVEGSLAVMAGGILVGRAGMFLALMAAVRRTPALGTPAPVEAAS